jgi:signal peptidase I
MGDNRNKSLDSRYIGPINEEKIFAKAGLRIWPINSFGLLR